MRGRDRRWMQARAVYDGDEEVTSKFLSPGHLLFIISHTINVMRKKIGFPLIRTIFMFLDPN
jgi:hypothetical protein